MAARLVSREMWHETYGGSWTFSQNSRSLAHTVWEWRCLEDLKQKDHWLNEWMNLQNSLGYTGSVNNGNKRLLQGKLFIEPFLCIFMVEDEFFGQIYDKKGRSDHFPQGTGCILWFFRMSARTKLICVINNSSPKRKKKYLITMSKFSILQGLHLQTRNWQRSAANCQNMAISKLCNIFLIRMRISITTFAYLLETLIEFKKFQFICLKIGVT